MRTQESRTTGPRARRAPMAVIIVLAATLVPAALLPATLGAAAPTFAEQGDAICSEFWSESRGVLPPIPSTIDGAVVYRATTLKTWLDGLARVATTTSKDLAGLKASKSQRAALGRLSESFSDLAAKFTALGTEYTTGTVTPDAWRTRYTAYDAELRPINAEVKAAAGELGFTSCVTPPSSTPTTTTLAPVTRAPVATSGKAIDTSKITASSAPSFGMEFQRGLLGVATANASTSAQGWGILPIWTAAYPSVKFVDPTVAAVPGQVSVSPPVKLGGKAKVAAATFALRDQVGCWAGIIWQQGKKFDTHELAIAPSNCTADAAMRYYEERGV